MDDPNANPSPVGDTPLAPPAQPMQITAPDGSNPLAPPTGVGVQPSATQGDLQTFKDNAGNDAIGQPYAPPQVNYKQYDSIYPSWINQVNPPAAEPEWKPGWWNNVEQASASAGIDSDVLWHIFGSERAYQSLPNPFQIMPGTLAGLQRTFPTISFGNMANAGDAGRAGAWLMKLNQESLQHSLGRKPTPTELYVGWGLGPRAPGVISAPPNTPIEKLLPPSWLAANPNVFNKVRTAGDYIWWSARRLGYDNPYTHTKIGDRTGLDKIVGD